MALVSRVTPTGWVVFDDSTTVSRVLPTGWLYSVGVAGGGGGQAVRTFFMFRMRRV